jgi:hypothetical protein
MNEMLVLNFEKGAICTFFKILPIHSSASGTASGPSSLRGFKSFEPIRRCPLSTAENASLLLDPFAQVSEEIIAQRPEKR